MTESKNYPIFIVGMNGSGTNMMLDHLGQHPQIFAFPVETYILPNFLRSAARYGNLDDDRVFRRLWSDIAATYPFRHKNAGAPLPLPADWPETRRSVAGIFDRIMLTFAARAGKRRWAEKTPMHVLHIQSLAREFPDARFLHMIRDGRDCAASDHRRWGRHPASTVFRWKTAISEGRRQGPPIGDRYIELRYEEVTRDPERQMAAACKFAGVDYDASVLTVGKDRIKAASSETGRIVPNAGRNKGYFDESTRRKLEGIAGRCLAELGYEVDYLAGDKDPDRLERAWWFVSDALRIIPRQIVMKLTVRKRQTWSLLFSKWKMILGSLRANSGGRDGR